MHDSTRTLIEKVLAGELDQSREIVRRFDADVFRLAAPVFGCRDAAEDLTQEAFSTAYRRSDAFDIEGGNTVRAAGDGRCRENSLAVMTQNAWQQSADSRPCGVQGAVHVAGTSSRSDGGSDLGDLWGKGRLTVKQSGAQ